VDTHAEDLKAKSLLQKVGFQKNTDCSADGDSDPSRRAKALRSAGRQDASGNREETRAAHLTEAEPC